MRTEAESRNDDSDRTDDHTWRLRSEVDAGWMDGRHRRQITGAHYENTILITDGEPEILSRADGIEL